MRSGTGTEPTGAAHSELEAKPLGVMADAKVDGRVDFRENGSQLT